MRGIDCPEIRTKSEKEKKLAIAAKEFAHELLFEKEVEIKNIEREKYGRILCDVYVGGKNVCEAMLEAGHGRKYEGGKRGSWD